MSASVLRVYGDIDGVNIVNVRQLALLVLFKLGRHATFCATLSIGCTAAQIKKVADVENSSHPVPDCFK